MYDTWGLVAKKQKGYLPTFAKHTRTNCAPPLPECGLHPRSDGLPDLQDGSLGGGGQGGSGQEDGGDGRGAEDTEGGGGAFCGACAGEGEVVWKPLDGTIGSPNSQVSYD